MPFSDFLRREMHRNVATPVATKPDNVLESKGGRQFVLIFERDVVVRQVLRIEEIVPRGKTARRSVCQLAELYQANILFAMLIRRIS